MAKRPPSSVGGAQDLPLTCAPAKRRKKQIRDHVSHPDGLPTGRKAQKAPWPPCVSLGKYKKCDDDYQVFVIVDEAGLGSYAGPLVCAAVSGYDPSIMVHDSKLMKKHERKFVYDQLTCSEHIQSSVVFLSNEEIDEKGIRQCWRQGMGRAAKNVLMQLQGGERVGDKRPEGAPPRVPKKTLVIVDGTIENLLGFEDANGNNVSISSLVQADRLTWQGAAAGVLAKEARDRHMEELAEEVHESWKGVFKEGKGYRWKSCHDDRIRLGEYTRFHRRSFNPLKTVLLKRQS